MESPNAHVKLCRICLETEKRLFDLQSSPLDSYFMIIGMIIGMNPLCTDLPPYACLECAHLMRKFFKFRQKCLQGQTSLYNIIKDNGQITLEQVKQLDRRQLQLTSSLEVCKLDSYPVEDAPQKDEKCPKYIKNELDEFIPNILCDIKEEHEFEDFCEPADVSSDDEPLSVHKTTKIETSERKENVKKKRKKKKENTVLEELTLQLDDLNDSAAQEPAPRKRPRRPRAAPAPAPPPPPPARKTLNTGGVEVDDIDLENYVTVIHLTLDEQLAEIAARAQSANYRNAKYQCGECYKGFVDTAAWDHHVRKHSASAGDVPCPVCKFRFKSRRALAKHAPNHDKKYACKSCSYVSKTTTQAKQHQRWHKGITYKCQYCDEVSTKWTSYLSHVRIKHPSQNICGVCGYSFVSPLGLAMHKTMMHKDVDTSVADPSLHCAECAVQFYSAEAWRRHLVTSARHTDKEEFKRGCKVCGETFASTELLRLHHRQQHARARPRPPGRRAPGAWPAPCSHCSEQIESARAYWTHHRRAHPDKDYPVAKNHICDQCGKSFRANAFLVYHMRTHSAERAFQCPQCPKAFFNRTNLQTHLKTHSELRPYPCALCYKAFKSKGALDRHMRCHTGAKPFECGVCHKCFGQSNSRDIHLRTVHLRQPAPYVSRSRRLRRAPLPPPAPHPPPAPAPSDGQGMG